MRRALFRDHVLRSGEPKVSYESKAAALEGCPLNQNVHRCRLCKQWHRHSVTVPRVPEVDVPEVEAS